jgi:hypothetical protein
MSDSSPLVDDPKSRAPTTDHTNQNETRRTRTRHDTQNHPLSHSIASNQITVFTQCSIISSASPNQSPTCIAFTRISSAHPFFPFTYCHLPLLPLLHACHISSYCVLLSAQTDCTQRHDCTRSQFRQGAFHLFQYSLMCMYYEHSCFSRGAIYKDR